eukprot:gnl/MRDRNA2_/MRDRNA2_97103_c0_seq1.p1 gnl/MRDRNA2_/MRDRNA2_97103_c0~~gnl/MRDRNA2_/MRDRNA2_97103_c0_seq1.p1  ORF type:complete len:445 (-),score=68.84 gnl/MRDRNA2_/MRDRNA2_97103_c0_seq1:119-1453(-)
MIRQASATLEAFVTYMLLLQVVESDAQGPFIVKLHRQVVPVKRGEQIVSHKSAYFGNVSLGYPPQEFSMVMDTGSGHVIVPSKGCTSIPCRSRRIYNRQMSETGYDIDHDGTPVGTEDERDQATIGFGTGEVTGEFVSEMVCVSPEVRSMKSQAWKSDKKVPYGCTRLRVVTAIEMSTEPFNSFNFDGVLGLGLQSLALTPEFSFFNSMKSAKGIRHPYFSLHLGQNDEDQAEVIFGDYTKQRLNAGLRWARVANSESGYWKVKIESVFIGKERLRICDSGDCVGIVDTGTSTLAVPKTNVIDFQQRLVQKVAGNRTDIDCRKEAGPEIHFKISGDLTLKMNMDDYVRPAPFLASADLLSRLKSRAVNPLASSGIDSPHAYCKPSILPIDMMSQVGGRTFIFGEPILRKYVTVFDSSVPRVGFASVTKDRKGAHSVMTPPIVTV